MTRVGWSERTEHLALVGAANDPRQDKSDWIRIWACARYARGLAASQRDWDDAFRLLHAPSDKEQP